MKRFSEWLKFVQASSLCGRFNRRSAQNRSRVATERLETRLVLSAFSIGGTGYDTAESMTTDDTGNVYVAGLFSGTVDLDPGPGTFQVTSGGGSNFDGYLAKYDSAGNFLWGSVLLDSSINGMTTDASGALYITGGFQGNGRF